MVDASVTGGYHHSVKGAASLIRCFAQKFPFQSTADHPWSSHVSNCLADEGYNLWVAELGNAIKWDHINFIKSTDIILCACLILTCAELSAEVVEVEGIDKASGNVHVPCS